MSIALNGWHPGERAIRDKLGQAYSSGYTATLYTAIDASMLEEHRVFYARNIPFLPLTINDAKGRPWAALVSGPKRTRSAAGRRGYGWVKSPSETELEMDLELWEGDPMLEALDSFDKDVCVKDDGRVLTAGLGIEFPTRRRNKFAGRIERVEKTGPLSRHVYLRVNQAIGNCPKYINVRTLDLYPDTSSQIVHRRFDMLPEERLPTEMVEFILQADTVFLATSYEAKETDKQWFPSHVGMNARGGRPGFVRVRPSDGRTLVLPDYSGNRILTSLGNIEASSRAGMTFLDFATGSILYITGTAKNLVGADAQALIPRQNVLTTLYTESFIFIRDALPVRQRPGTDVERSPYSPPIKFLAEEKEMQGTRVMDDVHATLTRIDILSPTLATFSFETDRLVKIRAGQAAALDFGDLLGPQQYAHMAPGNEVSVNDDRIRTWTVSSYSFAPEKEGAEEKDGGTHAFSLTMREKPGGLVTGALFNITRQLSVRMPTILEDTRPLGLRIRLVGITGTFTLQSTSKSPGETMKLLWIAGGIGMTPFLSMLRYIRWSSRSATDKHDIVFVLSTREAKVLTGLIRDALTFDERQSQSELRLVLHVYTTSEDSITANDYDGIGADISVVVHCGRPEFSRDGQEASWLVRDINERAVYLCGPPEFESAALDALEHAGVRRSNVLREGFGY